MPRQLTQALIEEWISLTKGQFNVRDIWYEVGIESSEGRNYLRVILGRLEKSGLIQQLDKGFGNYRRIDNAATEIDWEHADVTNTIDIAFPFGEEQYVKIYPKSIIIVAGSKNSGKTQYLYDFIKRNMANYKIDLFNSETGPEQMKERFTTLGIKPASSFKVYERYDNFADVIQPDRISVIDYLDLNSEVYLVGTEIDMIFRKLRAGVAIIGLQKAPPIATIVRGVKKLTEHDLAYGGGFTAKRAALYVTLGSNRSKLLYVKTPRQKNINPNNMAWSFSVTDNGHFCSIQRAFGDSSP